MLVMTKVIMLCLDIGTIESIVELVIELEGVVKSKPDVVRRMIDYSLRDRTKFKEYCNDIQDNSSRVRGS